MQQVNRLGMAFLTGLAALVVGSAAATANPWGDPVFYRVSGEAILQTTEVDQQFFPDVRISMECPHYVPEEVRSFNVQSLLLVQQEAGPIVSDIETIDLLVDEEFWTDIPNVHVPSDGSGRNLLVESDLGQIAAQREIRITYYSELGGPTSTTVRVVATGQMPRGCTVQAEPAAPHLNAP